MTTPSQRRGTSRARTRPPETAGEGTDSDASPEPVVTIPPESVVIVSDIPAGRSDKSERSDRNPDQIMDRELERSQLTADRGESRRDDSDPKAGPPRLDEWQDFFSRVLIRSATNWYIEFAFRGIDENQLTDREVERIKLEDQERERIARPFAELANKSKFTRKHGRTIVAAADSWDSVVTLGMWFNRVNRISRRHKTRNGTINVSPRQSEPQQPEASNGHRHGADVPQQRWWSTGAG